MRHRHPPKTLHALAALALAPLAPALAQPCPPGAFDYGPALDPHVELVVIGHYGPNDPLIPAPADYARAARDVDLIHAAIPATVGQMHGLGWQPNMILIQTGNPAQQELVCANQFYQATMSYLCCGNLWLIEFPRSVNCLAACTIYSAIPGVVTAALNIYGGIGGAVCYDSWGYRPDPHDNWRWDIYESHLVSFHGSPFCFSDGSWVVFTTPEGGIIVSCYANCDDSTAQPILNVNDFVCFQQRFAAGDPYANCDNSTTPPILNANDFVCFQQQFAAGCP